jgi:hypothetical protein
MILIGVDYRMTYVVDSTLFDDRFGKWDVICAEFRELWLPYLLHPLWRLFR